MFMLVQRLTETDTIWKLQQISLREQLTVKDRHVCNPTQPVQVKTVSYFDMYLETKNLRHMTIQYIISS